MSKKIVDQVYEMLKEVNDPELGIDIVNLGLIYEVDVDEGNNASIKMTMTSMGCPMAGEIIADLKTRISKMEEINDIQVDVVWSPPWSKDRLSRYAKMALGVPS
ncbi:metal-sulfur cluster assembly factor [Halalkalibacter alkalisediminis]|uniref:Metal-sulfur cluster assembly factor n=1 Tax=Halalkalibacter alkalisediminis TaxID=935616 RepID=A0ABV6NCI9_9BACI|nr:metal-sulfur cluster assembly factor [Halalkalibacter alkalisediminis]